VPQIWMSDSRIPDMPMCDVANNVIHMDNSIMSSGLVGMEIGSVMERDEDLCSRRDGIGIRVIVGDLTSGCDGMVPV